jgi:hypothetical protein
MIEVITPSATYDLTVLSTVKSELQITDTADDAFLSSCIRQASGMIASYCNRVFAKESVRETFRLLRSRPALMLSRYPVTEVTGISVDGEPLEETEWETDLKVGRVFYISDDHIRDWPKGKITVEYSGGYTLLAELPYEVERCCVDLVKMLYFSRARDPMLRSERVLDVIQQSWSTAGGETVGGLPRDIACRLDPYRSIMV